MLLLSLQGCYYLQAARGQLEVWREQRPLDEVIDDPATQPELAARLQLLGEARRFATQELLLPDNGSYRSYADLERNYVLWNVVAAPEFSLQPKTWCYPIVGCVGYRGYFSESSAEKLAARLRKDGYDVFVGGVAAYSTLGRFADPILNTMLARNDADLLGLLFHELAHQKLYIRDDTAFNESFASAVAEIGVRRWFEERGDGELADAWQRSQQRQARVTELLQDAREKLAALYASDLPLAEQREQKAQTLQRAARRVSTLFGGVAASPIGELNNARLASLAMYHGYVPAFRQLYIDCGRELACFYRRADDFAALPAEGRHAALAPPPGAR